jgi:polysaccharide deacetylase 2 family uncharacterized protein YibQ
VKFPKLPKFPDLSKLFRKKDADDEFDEFDDEFDDASDDARDSGDADGEDATPADGEDAAPADDDDVDFGEDDEYDDEDDENKTDWRAVARRPMVLAAAGFFVLLAGIAGGAGWWYFSDDDGATKSAAGAAGKSSRGPMVGLALPPRGTNASRGGGLNKFSGSAPEGVMTPSQPRKAALGAAPPSTPPAAGKPDTPRPSRSNSLARTVGDIGGRFGGRANPLGGSLNAIGGAAQEEGAGIVIPSVTSVTLKTIPNQKGGKPLGATPDARLIEKKKGLTGSLPITAKSGEVSWKSYARPFEGKDTGKRVAIVIMGFGLSRASGMAVIGKLPPQVTLALDPYAQDLSDWLVRARLVGHEVMMTLPMESERFPVQDAGPYSLDTSLKAEDNITRLELVLSQVTGYFGVATSMGSRFGTSEALLTPVLAAIKKRGLMLLTTGIQSSLLAPKIARKMGLPLVVGDITLDDDPSRAAVDAKLLRLERILKERKIAVAIAQPYPTTIARLNAWAKTLAAKKITLVPVSALINKQSAQ